MHTGNNDTTTINNNKQNWRIRAANTEGRIPSTSSVSKKAYSGNFPGLPRHDTLLGERILSRRDRAVSQATR